MRACSKAIAIDNAVEGCVHETYSAAFALVQSRTAADADVRATFGAIARDELRHAELAWELARWLDGLLVLSARRRVARARRRARDELLRTATREAPAAVVRDLGVPSARVAIRVAQALAASLWEA